MRRSATIPDRTRVLTRGRGRVLLVLAASITGCRPPAVEDEGAPWLEFDWPEADLLFQRDSHWLGGDGAYSVDLGDDRVLWLFGDSWVDPGGTGHRESARMISNTLAVQAGYDPSRADIEFFWGAGLDGEVGAFFPDFEGGRYWPGHGLRIRDRLLLFLMEVIQTDSGLGFEVSGSAAVLVENPEDDPPDWRIRWIEVPESEHGVVVGAGGIVERDGYVYAFSPREPGGPHDVYLVRWPAEEIAEGRLSGAEWWNGDQPSWEDGVEGARRARPVFTNGQTEFTVHADPASGQLVETQTSGFGPAVIVQRTAPGAAGPWSAPDTVFHPAQNRFPRIMVYQGKAHPHLQGAPLVVTYCTNSFEFGDHLTTPWLY